MTVPRTIHIGDVFINGDLHRLTPADIAQLQRYAAMPRWQRFLWRHGIGG